MSHTLNIASHATISTLAEKEKFLKNAEFLGVFDAAQIIASNLIEEGVAKIKSDASN